MLSVGPGARRFSPSQNIYVKISGTAPNFVIYITDSTPSTRSQSARSEIHRDRDRAGIGQLRTTAIFDPKDRAVTGKVGLCGRRRVSPLNRSYVLRAFPHGSNPNRERLRV